tara:strand:- start:627 stop:923 length:297 start_codon:yes stop_codon:yes gene_type:complete
MRFFNHKTLAAEREFNCVVEARKAEALWSKPTDLQRATVKLQLFILKRNRRALIRRMSGVSMNTMWRFLAGHDIRLHTLIKIEKACEAIKNRPEYIDE